MAWSDWPDRISQNWLYYWAFVVGIVEVYVATAFDRPAGLCRVGGGRTICGDVAGTHLDSPRPNRTNERSGAGRVGLDRDLFRTPGGLRVPSPASLSPIGLNLLLALLVLGVSLAASASLRALLSNQPNLVRLHLWRLLGVTFLLLMFRGRLPALFALPAGTGDILIAVTAPWIAANLDMPGGRRRAIVWNWLGLADLLVAIGLGVTTNPGAPLTIATVPTSEVMTRFPMALVPAFLVPLAMTLHVVSLWQLLRGSWAQPPSRT